MFPLTDVEIQYEEGSFMAEVWDAFETADQKISAYIGNEDTPEGFEKNMLEIVQLMLNGDRTEEEAIENIQAIWEQYSGGDES